jgi:hypothetical protein
MKWFRANRWWIVLLACPFPWLFGYHGTFGLLSDKVFPAVGFWFWGFDRARRGKPRLFDGALTRESERVLLFAAATIAAVIMVAGSQHQEVARRGEELLYLAIGFTVMRQGYRIGGRWFERWEYVEDVLYGSLGDVVVMLVLASVFIAKGETVGALQLALVIAPMGMIAVSDEPSYVNLERYVGRYLTRMYRRMELDTGDEAW